MATHPFAIKLERAIVHARSVLESLREAKRSGGERADAEPWWDWVDSLGRKRVTTKIVGAVRLGALVASGAERQATISPGEALFSFDLAKGRKNQDKEFQALSDKLHQEEALCEQARQMANRDARTTVSMECPGLTAARKAMEAYVKKRPRGPRGAAANSGGGGGGGW